MRELDRLSWHPARSRSGRPGVCLASDRFSALHEAGLLGGPDCTPSRFWTSPRPRARSRRAARLTKPGSDPNRETRASHILRGLLPGNPPAMPFDKHIEELGGTALELRRFELQEKEVVVIPVPTGVGGTG
jgi:hypothetical protein